MRFARPTYPCEFELPDDWLEEASGCAGFVPATTGFRSTEAAVQIPLIDIEAPVRLKAWPLSFKGFDRIRVVSVLLGIVDDAVIEPVPLLRPIPNGTHALPNQYRVLNGVHRFYASIAAGFTTLPGDIM